MFGEQPHWGVGATGALAADASTGERTVTRERDRPRCGLAPASGSGLPGRGPAAPVVRHKECPSASATTIGSGVTWHDRGGSCGRFRKGRPAAGSRPVSSRRRACAGTKRTPAVGRKGRGGGRNQAERLGIDSSCPRVRWLTVIVRAPVLRPSSVKRPVVAPLLPANLPTLQPHTPLAPKSQHGLQTRRGTGTSEWEGLADTSLQGTVGAALPMAVGENWGNRGQPARPAWTGSRGEARTEGGLERGLGGKSVPPVAARLCFRGSEGGAGCHQTAQRRPGEDVAGGKGRDAVDRWKLGGFRAPRRV